MTRKTLSLSASALVLATALSGCGGGNDADTLVQVQMSEASYQNLYGAYADTCDDVAGDSCAAQNSY